MRNWLDRQSFLGSRSDAALASTRIAIFGLGGGGSHIAQQAAHVGIGHIQLADEDVIENTNLNRVVGATKDDVKQKLKKVLIAKRMIERVNPDARVDAYPFHWQIVAQDLRSCHAIFGCVDSFKAREEIEIFARRYHIPYIDIGMDVTQIKGTSHFAISGQITLSMPGGPCLRCLHFLNDGLITREVQRYGAAGSHPQVVWANAVLASHAIATLITLLTPWCAEPPCLYTEYDGNTGTLSHSSRLAHIRICDHFKSQDDFGDPFFN